MSELKAQIINKYGNYVLQAVPMGIGLPIDTVQKVIYTDVRGKKYVFELTEIIHNEDAK